jgi:hypothetical protein
LKEELSNGMQKTLAGVLALRSHLGREGEVGVFGALGTHIAAYKKQIRLRLSFVIL